MKRHYGIALLIFLAVTVVLGAGAYLFTTASNDSNAPVTGNLDAATLQVAKNLYCPVCPGVTLDVCDTQACEQWRGQIHTRLGEGQTPEQIRAFFVEQYGERVLGAPLAQGFNLVVYILPILIIALGAALLYLAAQRWVIRRAAEPAPATPINDNYRTRIEQELKENG